MYGISNSSATFSPNLASLGRMVEEMRGLPASFHPLEILVRICHKFVTNKKEAICKYVHVMLTFGELLPSWALEEPFCVHTPSASVEWK